MKTIGLIDYYISEWHANNYPKWIKEICDEQGEDIVIKYAWAEEYVSLVDGKNTDEWCKEFNVEKCDSIKELCDKSDYIMILAPSNPEKHLGYAEETFKFANGKNVYIDKTFAPDYNTAVKIYELADKYGVKFFTSSALRYATEIDEFIDPNHPEFNKPKSAIITFGGGNLPEYLVHPLEIAVKMMGVGASEVKIECPAKRHAICSVKYADGRSYTLIYSPPYDFIIDAIEMDDLHFMHRPVVSATFNGLLKDVLRFYKTGEVSFHREQTLEIMKVREALIKALNNEGQWQKI